MNGLMAHGVLKDYTAGMQRYTTTGERAGCSIFEIAAYGVAQSCELAAYLVVAPGVELHLYELIALAGTELAHLQGGSLGLGNLTGVGIGSVLLLVACEPMNESERRLGD